MPTPTPSVALASSATAPAANAVVVDTGPLEAGTYRVEAEIAFADTLAAGKLAQLQLRDAANANTVHGAAVVAGQSRALLWAGVQLKANERVRVVNGGVAGAASSVLHGAIRLYRS